VNPSTRNQSTKHFNVEAWRNGHQTRSFDLFLNTFEDTTVTAHSSTLFKANNDLIYILDKLWKTKFIGKVNNENQKMNSMKDTTGIITILSP
jgi:hypothetical protein